MATSRISLKSTKTLNLLNFNIDLFFPRMELELDVLGIITKLLEDVIHFWR
jgi:hypothetical protein